jgi:hypothetical protein
VKGKSCGKKVFQGLLAAKAPKPNNSKKTAEIRKNLLFRKVKRSPGFGRLGELRADGLKVPYRRPNYARWSGISDFKSSGRRAGFFPETDSPRNCSG